MGDARASEAAALIWQNWRNQSRIDALPESCRPRTLAEGYAAQAELSALSGWQAIGWKIAATSAAGQKHIGVDGPLAGRLLAGKLHESGAELPAAHLHMAVMEAEFVFRLAEDLPARGHDYSPEDVVAATASLHLGIEVPDSRFEDFSVVGAPQLIADNACTEFFVLGAAVPESWRDLDLAGHQVSVAINGKTVAEGTGANVLGDPRRALAWLANDRVTQGAPLRAGEFITTGTCIVPAAIKPGDQVVADFGALGRVNVQFTP
ncbi:MAG: fumarylacetoacetate hydrolase family protein [Proteobacteria bacterium]|nr:fumarylacetoacetate hydrolase family protein [Pseudomonadota bacterium]MDA1355330.1 fumarylacetoacetate hydrolase family protein [Pseudomonadota bacterium]